MARPNKNFYSFISYKGKRNIIIVGLVIGFTSLLFTSNLTRRMRIKEQKEVQIWALAMQHLSYVELDPFFEYIINVNQTIPFVVIDENINPIIYNLIDPAVIRDKSLLRNKLDALSQANPAIEISDGVKTVWLYYDHSLILKTLYYFPYIQISIIAIFVAFSFIAFSSSKQDEQNRIWIGMAKETAHQLGTPTSSLLGWIEYLRAQNVDEFAIDEMNKDLTRLLKVVDRFSKIGAVTTFSPRDINRVVEGTVDYFRSRIPKNVELRFQRSPQPEFAMINDALFEWVIENLLKNALDALQGRGVITVKISKDERWLNIDVTDTGKGMTRANFKRIFEPGFSTKTRGWGLGLSLSRRIIEEYHKGRIYVLDSELEKGTIMRVSLHREDVRRKKSLKLGV